MYRALVSIPPHNKTRWSVDQLDQRAPGLVEWLLWLQGLVSLALHVVTVGVNLGVIWVSGGRRRVNSFAVDC